MSQQESGARRVLSAVGQLVLVVAMFFASFPMPTSTAAMQMLAPNQMRAQISAVFLLVSNLIGLGVGTTVVALITDKVLASPKAVGVSMSIVNLVATLLAISLLWLGCAHFRRSIIREDQHKARAVENAPPRHDTSSPTNVSTLR